MAIKPSQLHHADLLAYLASLLEAAQLLVNFNEGYQLALEIIDFVQQVAKEAANEDEQF
ncbi:hypothetical protein JZM24_04915 [Candidatus Sodalis endolongispinus]|uniref:Prophage protein n=1 Tax=Candidatus Sodalis endolongispinus TaxID=2812662 RepID=A0ABS5YC25_9GAMM|nr:hypothetical protein [Candidatus Sodalis endolongispinus]MBT9431651.1 hypothetical protein [Candidatus Sodalis endolongispinus]